MIIDSFTTKVGSEAVKLGKLTVFVGPNNCGKSYTGIGVHELFRKKYAPSCISDLFGKPDTVFSNFSRKVAQGCLH